MPDPFVSRSHVFREAERFLYIIDAFEASLNMNKQIV